MNVFEQTWPGFKAGCNCTGIFSPTVRKQNGYYGEQCNINEHLKNCNNTKSVDGVKIR